MPITKLKIMTYNVQWFSGVNSQLEMQQRIMDKYHPQIIGLQELSTTGRINSVGRKTLAEYENQYMSLHKNYLGIASIYALKNVRSYDFKHQDPEDMARYGETRAYMTGTLDIDGKKIKIINTHLCFHTPSVKYIQMKEIFRSAEKAEYAVILGDFNCFDGEYERMFGRFEEAGYRIANCGPTPKKTWTDKPNPKWLSRMTFPTDNIIVSPNITIKKVMFDKVKLKYPTGDPMDHIAVIARLYIK